MAAPGPVAHELNTSFSWADHGGPFRAVAREQANQYDELGYFVLEDALGPAEVDELTSAIDPFEAQHEEALRSMEGGRFFIARADEITFTTHLVLRSALLRSFTSSKLFADLCADLIGPDVRLYWDQAVYKKPGTESPFPVAPGQRVCVRRTPAVPHVLGGADRCHRGERVPVGGARPAPSRHTGP